MEKLTLKLKLMLLWLWIPIAMTACVLAVAISPGGFELLVSETQTTGIWATLSGVVIWLGPLIMAFLSLTLKDRANRNTNRVLSIIYAAFLLAELVTILFDPMMIQIPLEGSTVVAAAFLIFYSWKWPVKGD
jgi:hypothetical protein